VQPAGARRPRRYHGTGGTCRPARMLLRRCLTRPGRIAPTPCSGSRCGRARATRGARTTRTLTADMPPSYFPHADGLSLAEGSELIGELLRDPRLRLVELSEYAALRDRDQPAVGRLVDVLARSRSDWTCACRRLRAEERRRIRPPAARVHEVVALEEDTAGRGQEHPAGRAAPRVRAEPGAPRSQPRERHLLRLGKRAIRGRERANHVSERLLAGAGRVSGVGVAGPSISGTPLRGRREKARPGRPSRPSSACRTLRRTWSTSAWAPSTEHRRLRPIAP
jgi:hypothetical protein